MLLGDEGAAPVGAPPADCQRLAAAQQRGGPAEVPQPGVHQRPPPQPGAVEIDDWGFS